MSRIDAQSIDPEKIRDAQAKLQSEQVDRLMPKRKDRTKIRSDEYAPMSQNALAGITNESS